MTKREDLIAAAQLIKDHCADNGVYNEEDCPFFRGYDIMLDEKDGSTIHIIKCALNLGQTSPCNWKF